MNSGGSFQDLLNTDTITEGIDDVKSDLLALENEVKDNTLDITANTLGIGQNTTAISNNGVLINNNTSNIALETLRITLNANEIIQHDGEITTLQLDRISDLARITINEQDIQTNTNNIQTNTIAITGLGNDVLRRDGSISLDPVYVPALAQSIATKDYVDTHNTSTAYLRVDGSNSMTGDLELDGNDLKIDGNTSKFYIENFSNNLVMASQNNLVFVRGGAIDIQILSSGINFYKDLDMNQQNIINASLINGFNLSSFDSAISTNTANITTNTNNILIITNAVPTKLSLSGGTMSGTLDMAQNLIYDVSSIYTNTVVSMPNTRFRLIYNERVGNTEYLHYMIEFQDKTKITIYAPFDMQTFGITNCGLINGINISDLATDADLTTEVNRATAAELVNYNLALDRLRLDGVVSMQGDLNMGTHSINNVSTVNVDSKITIDNSSQGQNYIQLAGGASSGTENKIGYQLTFGGGLEIWGSGASPNRSMRIRDILECDTINGATSTEMGYLSGVSSGIQSQINLKLSSVAQNFLNMNLYPISNVGSINGMTAFKLQLYDQLSDAQVLDLQTPKVPIQSNGDVIISSNLRINGTKNTNVGNFRYFAYGGYGGYASGVINVSLYCPTGRAVAAEFDATSDRRCKTDIENIPDEKIDNFMNLEAKQYHWKEEKERLKYGFIAQDVIQQDLMPCVNFAESKGMMGGTDPETGVNNPADICMNLNYDSMIPLLQKALKKAMDRITILENKIAALI